jgi:anhydro-N-acetylmuramic acid kinase
LGGFGNISVKEKGGISAYDICPVNIPLNELAAQRGLQFDRDGAMAAKGNIIPDLLEAMNSLSYYTKQPPKSLGREWYEECYSPILKSSKCSTEDLLATVCEHIAIKIAASLRKAGKGGILITGGGAKNRHLISRINAVSGRKTEIPAEEVIDYKEALIFAYLATLRTQSKLNCLKSYTGARADLCAGQLHLGRK